MSEQRASAPESAGADPRFGTAAIARAAEGRTYRGSAFALLGLLGIAGCAGRTPLGAQAPDGASPLHPVVEVTTAATCLAAEGDLVYACLGRRVHSFDFAALDTPVEVAASPRLPAPVTALAWVGSFGYAATDAGAVHVLDARERGTLRPGEVVALPGGARVAALAVSGATLYATGADGRVHVIDITRPDAPWWLAAVATRRRVHSLVVTAGTAFVSDRWGFSTIDVTDPRRLAVVGDYDRPDTGSSELDGSLAVVGAWAFIGLRPGLHVVDVTHPERPRPVARNPLDGEWVARLATRGQRLVAILSRYPGMWDRTSQLAAYEVGEPPHLKPLTTVSLRTDDPLLIPGATGGRVWLADAWSGIRGLDLDASTGETAAVPVEWAEVVLRLDAIAPAGGDGEVLAVARHRPGAATAEIALFDVESPDAPAELGSVAVPGDVVALGQSGQHLVALGSTALHLIHVWDPGRPALVGSLLGLGRAVGLAVEAGLAVVAHPPNGLTLVDIGNPVWPVIAGRVADRTLGSDVVLHRSTIYSGGGTPLRIHDAGDPAAPREIDPPEIDVGYPGPGRPMTTGLELWGDRLVAGISGHRMAILGLADPQAPVLEGLLELPQPWVALGAGPDRWIYGLSEPEDGGAALHVVDAGDPAAPRLVGRHPLPGLPRAVTAGGDAVWVAARQAGWLGFSSAPRGTATPTLTPRPTGTLAPAPRVSPPPSPTPHPDRPHTAYLPVLQQPAPAPKASVRFEAVPRVGGVSAVVATDGSHAFLLEGGNRIVIWDVRDPHRLVRRSTFTLPTDFGPADWQAHLIHHASRLIVASSHSIPAPPYAITRLGVVDVATPEREAWLGSVDIPGRLLALAAIGDHAFVSVLGDQWIGHPSDTRAEAGSAATHPSALVAVGLSGPGAPRVAGQVAAPSVPWAVADAGRRLEGVCLENKLSDEGVDLNFGLCVFDVGDPAHPRLVAHRTVGELWTNTETAALTRVPGGYVFTGIYLPTGDGNALRFHFDAAGEPVDIEPLQLGPYGSDTTPSADVYELHAAAATDRHLLGFDASAGNLVVLALDDLSNPEPVALMNLGLPPGHRNRTTVAGSMALAGETLVLAGAEMGGLRLFRPLEPGGSPARDRYVAPGLVGPVAVDAGRVYTCGPGGFEIWDRAAPDAVVYATGADDGCDNIGLEVALGTDVAYVGRHSRLTAVDLTDPRAPAALAPADWGAVGVRPDPNARDIDTDGRDVYMADANYGLRILRASAGAGWTHIGDHPTVGQAYAVAVEGARAYVGTSKELMAFDVADPAQPTEIGFVRLAAPVLAVAAHGDGVMAVTGPDESMWRAVRPPVTELVSIDMGDPRRPRVVGSLHLWHGWRSTAQVALRWMGDRVFVQGLAAIDVSDRARPVLVGSFADGNPFALAPGGEWVYLGGNGLGAAKLTRLP